MPQDRSREERLRNRTEQLFLLRAGGRRARAARGVPTMRARLASCAGECDDYAMTNNKARIAATAIALAAAFGVGTLSTTAVQAHPKKHAKVHHWTDSQVLAHTLPYYNETAPRWCEEDMACWIGSNADGRSDHEILVWLDCDIAASSFSYVESPNDKYAKDRDFRRAGCPKD